MFPQDHESGPEWFVFIMLGLIIATMMACIMLAAVVPD
jgi:hypothetical protein